MIDKIKQKLEYGGYKRVQAPGFPCQIMLKRTETAYAVCLIEDSTILGGQSFQLDYLQETVQHAVEKQFAISCQTIALIISDNIAQDKVLAEGRKPVWLIGLDGKRIVFDNQPGTFGDIEILLEKKMHVWNLWFPKGTKLPWVTLGLVLINLIVQAIVDGQIRIAGDSSLMNMMVLQIGDFLRNPQYYRILSAAFLHFGWTHFFNNMLVLVFLGKTAEQIAGKLPFALGYLLCAVGANAVSVWWYALNGETYVSTAGASGAVFAVAGMMLAWVILNKGHLESVSLRQLVLMMAFTIYHGIAEGGVNNCAHITGAVMGFVFGIFVWFLSKRRKAIAAK